MMVISSDVGMESCGSVSSRYSAGRNEGSVERLVRMWEGMVRDVGSSSSAGKSSSESDSEEACAGSFVVESGFRFLAFSDCFLRISSRSFRFLREAVNCLDYIVSTAIFRWLNGHLLFHSLRCIPLLRLDLLGRILDADGFWSIIFTVAIFITVRNLPSSFRVISRCRK